MNKLTLFLGAALLSSGCAQSSYAKHFEALKNYTPIVRQVSEDGKENFPFDKLNSGLEEYIKEIYFIRLKDFFAPNEIGHVHTCSQELKTTVCISLDARVTTEFHEAGHARTYALNKLGQNIFEKWKEIAGIEYGKVSSNEFWNDNSVGPKNGCLEPYGGTKANEDISTFLEPLGYELSVDEVRKEFESEEFEFFPNLSLISKYPLYFCDPQDSRYQKKIDFLKEHNYITEEEHKRMKEQLGVLHHLLNQ